MRSSEKKSGKRKKMDKIQERGIYLALRGHNILFTGFPGTGKSFTVIELAKQLKAIGKNVVVTATTGIASQGLRQKLPEHFGAISTIHKFVGLKDGRYENDELLNLIVHDENFVDIKNNIKAMDTLIIDEISMLSSKLLEQIQYIFQSVRCSACPFGGVQMILSGDFYQLPPVPNINYGDNGQMCYNSLYVKTFFHHVQLDMIHRQEEPDFISALHQIAGGNITEETCNLFNRLKRTLPPGPDPVHLFAENFDVEMWNSDRIMEIDGEIKLYKAEDSGEKKHLASIQAPKLLPLKVSCPVMLTVNLSEHLVNGLTGIVTDLQDNSVQVHFPSLNKKCNLSAFPFTVYDKQKHVDIACRRQIPLKLSFALTVHKAQGLSLNRVSVNCSKMNQDGQIYVALSRATCKKGLQVRNFNKALLKKPTDNILDFYSLPQKFPHDNLLCCTRNENEEISQSSESDLEAIFDPSYEPQDIFLDEDEEMYKCVSFIETYDEDNIAYHLPESVNPDQILKTVQPKFSETAEQKSELNVIEKMKSSRYTVKLLQYFWNAFMILKEKIFVEGKVTNKATTDFYREINQFLIQDKMMNMVNIFDGDVAARQNVVFRLSSEVRKMVLEHSVSLIKQKAKEKGEKEKGIAYAESPGGRGKIRYIGGWCVRSIKRIKKAKLMKNLYKEKKRELNLNLRKQLDLLDKLESTEYQLLETSEDTESLDEIMRKQNVRKGLTNISDKCFNFFLLLDKKIRLLETTANIDIHGTNFHSFVISQLQKDESLLNAFNSQFSTQISQEEAKTLQNEFISKYSMMSLCQLRKSYLKDMKSKKTEAHRKQIKMREKSGRSGGKSSLFNLTSIKEDTSVGKMISHRRLQSEILKTEDFLSSTFTKAELEKLSLAYKCPFDKKLSKKSTSEKLYEVISSSESMLNTSTFGNLGSPDDSVNLAPLEAQCIEPVASTSGLVSVSQSKVSNVSPPVIVKRMRPTKRGKKGQKKRKTGPKYPCGMCKRECEDNVLCCDGCDSWFHADCLKIEDLDELPDEWFCNECGNI